MKLGIIIGTTREGRQTVKQATWVAKAAGQLADTEVTTIDLIDYDLPMFAEAISPRYNPNRQPIEVAQKWMDALAAQDAYIFVTPEYNHSIPGVLKNALDYVAYEMVHKPAAIVSHGAAGGARAAMHLKEILSEGQALPIPKGVSITNMSEIISDDGELAESVKANPYGPQAALDSLLTDLKWTSDVLSAGRNQ